ncbi:MAG TPA: PcfJ domain-containing protein [Kiritimatiellia bacterium]|nr:PcfJ domain-containing protein [Kiritimatiellia bacterium]HQG74790.1 PcfJ domain-containing protein [Kiritimatiellia bacterium]HXK78760.1 PcfJ domain-containing protein [Kiritimatiellia bacterium]
MHWLLHPQRPFPRMASTEKFREYYDELAALLTNPGVAPPSSWVPLPSPPIADSEEIQAIQTHRELWKERRQQHNCVATYVGRVTSGSVYIYRVLKLQRATLAIARHRDQWHIDELKGTYNQPVDQATFQAVKNWLDESQLGV